MCHQGRERNCTSGLENKEAVAIDLEAGKGRWLVPQGHVHKLLGDSFTRAENRRQYKNEAEGEFWGQVLYPR